MRSCARAGRSPTHSQASGGLKAREEGPHPTAGSPGMPAGRPPAQIWNNDLTISLLHSADMRPYNWSYAQFSQFNQDDSLLLASGVSGCPSTAPCAPPPGITPSELPAALRLSSRALWEALCQTVRPRPQEAGHRRVSTAREQAALHG